MGRKQNPLVAEFFDRGQRLSDSSNRYEQTCRACHEKFPKGRVDALTGHLLKRCPGLKPPERQRVIHELSTKPHENSGINQTARELQGEQGDEVDMALSPGGLGSRKRKRVDPRAHKEQEQYENTFRLDLDGYKNTTPERQVKESEDSTAIPVKETTAEEQLLHDLSRLASQQQTQQTAQGQSDGHNALGANDGALTSDQLAFAANAASELVLPAHGVDGAIGNDQDTAIDPQLQSGTKTKSRTLQDFKRKGLIFHHVRPGANPETKQAPYMQGFHVETDKPGSKASNDRNRAVQDLRRAGACIRCRMLKKPCSDESPCSTCSNIETARRWRQPCTRARISDEFDLLREDVHMLLATSQMGFAESLSSPTKDTSGVIEATHFPGETVPPATFSSVHGQLRSPFPQAASTPFAGGLEGKRSSAYEVLEQDYGNIAENLALYLENAEQHYCKRESSILMRETLLMARERLEHKTDTVLREAVALWVTVYVLVDPDADWQIQSVRQPDAAQLESLEGLIGSMDITSDSDPLSHRLVTAQLLEFAEKRATNLCKSVMHEFEKRMVHRQRVRQLQFETFLTAVILLGCLERLAWLYQTWTTSVNAPGREIEPDREHDHHSHRERRPAIARGIWPTKRSPEDFVDRADFVADIIAMLCRLRELPPPMKLDVEGYLIADLDLVPRKTSRYDASGYKGIVKKSQAKNQQKDKTPSEEGPPEDTARGQETSLMGLRGFDQHGQFDEHHAALVAQLHHDLQASSGAERQAGENTAADRTGGFAREPTNPNLPSISDTRSTGVTTADVVMAGTPIDLTSLERGSKDQEEGALENGNDRMGDLVKGREQSPDQVPEDKGDEENEANAEDPFMLHLRQAQAAARAAGDNNYQDQPYQDQDAHELESETEQDDGQPRAPRPVEIWFKRVRLKVADLFNARDNPPWDEKDCHCWELKYISRMLLPDT